MKSYIVFVLFFSVTLSTYGQKFDRIDTIPVTENSNLLKNPWAGGINFPSVNSIDVNGDGRKDIFIFDKHNNRTSVFLNNGSTNYREAWDYAPNYNNKFPVINQWVLLYDYNCDGKEDLFTLSPISLAAMAVYRNDFTPGNGLQWTLVNNFLDESFDVIRQNIFVNGVSLPGLADIDGDGDMDVLGYNSLPDGRIAYHKNYSMEHYGVCDSLDFKYESGCWGDFSLLIGGANQVGCFHCPCRVRRPGAPMPEEEYEQPSSDQSVAAPLDDTISGMYIMDIDGDGDQDLLIGDVASFNSLLIVNGGTNVTADMSSQDTGFPSYDVAADFAAFHYHCLLDVDNDGIKDLLVFPNFNENIHGMWFYRNVGTNAVPVFEYVENSFLQNEMIDVGENAAPVLYDYDNDGLLDLIVGYDEFVNGPNTHKIGLRYYKNVGTLTAPAFDLIDRDLAAINQYNFASPIIPTFGDLDGDGDKDLILGIGDGRLARFINTGGSGVSNFVYDQYYYSRIDVGKFATPQIYDLNGDGLNDLLIGEQNGFVNYFHNTGTLNAPIFDSIPTNDTLGCIVIQGAGTPDGFTVPFMYDSTGSKRLFIANENGLIYKYDNISGNINGCYNNFGNAIDTSESSRIKFNITVSGGDLNGDGLMDLVIGQSTGGVEVRYQHNPSISVQEIGIVKPSMELFPNPTHALLHLKFYNLFAEKNSLVRIISSTGEIIAEKLINSTSTEFNTENLSAGIYCVQLISGNSVVTRKVNVIR